MVSIVRLCQVFEIEVGRMIVSDDRLEYNQIAAPNSTMQGEAPQITADLSDV